MSVIFSMTVALFPVSTAAMQAEQEEDGIIIVMPQRGRNFGLYRGITTDSMCSFVQMTNKKEKRKQKNKITQLTCKRSGRTKQ
jgi:hypothetical protein